MALKKDLKIKAQLKIEASGDVQLSVFKTNNFADNYDVTITDSDGVPNTESFNGTGLRVYTTGKEPTNPVDALTPLSLVFDGNWKIEVTFNNTAGDELLKYNFTAYASSTETYVYDFELVGKSTQVKTA